MILTSQIVFFFLFKIRKKLCLYVMYFLRKIPCKFWQILVSLQKIQSGFSQHSLHHWRNGTHNFKVIKYLSFYNTVAIFTDKLCLSVAHISSGTDWTMSWGQISRHGISKDGSLHSFQRKPGKTMSKVLLVGKKFKVDSTLLGGGKWSWHFFSS